MGNSGLFVASSVMVSKKESTESEGEFDPGALGTSGVFTEEANARGTGLDVNRNHPLDALRPAHGCQRLVGIHPTPEILDRMKMAKLLAEQKLSLYSTQSLDRVN